MRRAPHDLTESGAFSLGCANVADRWTTSYVKAAQIDDVKPALSVPRLLMTTKTAVCDSYVRERIALAYHLSRSLE